MAAAGYLPHYLNDPLPYVCRSITVNVLSASLNKTFPSFQYSYILFIVVLYCSGFTVVWGIGGGGNLCMCACLCEKNIFTVCARAREHVCVFVHQ